MKPIIFNTEMVRAILDGRKTQTSRVINPQPPDDYFKNNKNLLECPYGQPGDLLWVKEVWMPSKNGKIIYKATDTKPDNGKWRSPLYMPRIASRIILKITYVKIERLKDMTLTDILDEGINLKEKNIGLAWIKLWNSIYEKRGYGWNKNPWVWVIKFEKKEKKNDEI